VDAPLHLFLQTPRRIRTRCLESNPRAPAHTRLRGFCAGFGIANPAESGTGVTLLWIFSTL
jgi:hypothetical protein